MRTVFADAFFYFALVNSSDPAHARATQFLATYRGRFVTTLWVLTEVADGLARPASHRQLFLTLYQGLVADPNTRIVRHSDALFRDALDLYTRRPDKHWSLTDCASFVVMGRDGITDALTGDHHFEQAGFVAILK